MDWKSPADVLAWENARATRKKRLEKVWQDRWYPILYGVASTAGFAPGTISGGIDATQGENESLGARNRRLEAFGDGVRPSTEETNDNYVPRLVAYDQEGDRVIFSPSARHATEGKRIKAAGLAVAGLQAKANRELACGILGGEVVCTAGHHFRVGYECGNRYCITCGPKGARKLFAQKHEQLFAVAQRLMLCDEAGCTACALIRRQQNPDAECQQKTAVFSYDPDKPGAGDKIKMDFLPHWPPIKGQRPRVVVAKIDFTVVNTGKAAPELMRELNLCIKRFCRALERLQLVPDRQSYGLATCDELGAGNSNIHAHGVYVGPWLPQDKTRKQLSQLWAKVTGYKNGRRKHGGLWQGGFILSIKYADDFSAALYHAIKYPAKFAEKARPERLAELEQIFHRVRRFHCYAAFYNTQTEKTEPEHRSCPLCNSRLFERGPWRLLRSRSLAQLKDIDLVASEVGREKTFKSPVVLPPVHSPP